MDPENRTEDGENV